jgi:glycosyltransferase involved in cell wall biosynthesis
MASADTRLGPDLGVRPGADGAPKLVFLVTEDWYFWAHRLPQARAARDAGFRVAVATRVDRHGELIRGEGFELYPLAWRRGSVNLLGALAALVEIWRLYRRLRPALAHHVSQKPILIGSVAARLAGVPRVVNAFTGLGFMFAATSFRARLLRAASLPVLRLATSGRSVRFLVENPDDRATLERRGIGAGGRIVLIRGSGVDIAHYRPLPEPEAGPVVVGCATRMLRIKGVAEIVAAFELLRARGSTVRLLLAGASDPENPAAIPEAEMRDWASRPGIEWLGQVEDVREVWARTHIAVLASLGGEGIPMSLMEAAACGRPLVATDVPGCREIAREGETGLVVPPGDVAALADAIERLAADGALRRRLGAAARARIVAGLDSRTVGRETVRVYNELLSGPCSG